MPEYTSEEQVVLDHLGHYRDLAEQAGFPQHVIDETMTLMESTRSCHLDSLAVHETVFETYMEIGYNPEYATARSILQSFAAVQMDLALREGVNP